MRRFGFIGFVTTCLVLAVSMAHSGVEITQPLMILADQDGTPLEGVSKSSSAVEAMEKASALGDGVYLLIRPTTTITVTGSDVPDPDPDPEPTPTPDPNEPPADGGIVYTRVPRTLSTTVEHKDGPITIPKLDILDDLQEVSNIYDGMNAPGQMVMLVGGAETVIYDCYTDDQPCVPLDPAVSLDGKRIAFAVYRASGYRYPAGQGYTYPNKKLGSGGTESQIYIYTIATGETVALPHVAGVQDTSPVFLPDGSLMISSDQDMQYQSVLNNVGQPSKPAPRLFLLDPETGDRQAISPHETGGALHPILLADGTVAYSSQWVSHNLLYGSNNSSPQFSTTPANKWAVMGIDQRGGDIVSLLGGHGFSVGGKTRKALHFLGQLANGDVCVANYYRANNHGLGDVFCWSIPNRLLEGDAPYFVPNDIYPLAEWSRSGDGMNMSPDAAKIGFPEGLPNGQALVAMGQGPCSTAGWGRGNAQAIADQLGDRPGCDVGLYATTVIPSVSLSDMVQVVDSPEWLEFGARSIHPRSVPILPMSSTGDGSCRLVSTDAGRTDLHNPKEYDFNSGSTMTAGAQYSEIQGLPHSDMTAMRFYEVEPNRERYPPFRNAIGNVVRLFGDVPLLPDGSFVVDLPCDTPYVMAGLDSDGRVIKRDQLPQSLRPGEKRVCTGCHLHGEMGRPYSESLAANAEPVDLLVSSPVPTYTADIEPILQARCMTCHDDLPTTYEGWVWDFAQKEVPADRKVQVGGDSDGENKKYGLQRPMLSHYVSALYARESKLYWMAAGRRTDGRTDDQYSDDIDFGADHPQAVTDDELRLIAAWLDSGATE